MLLLKGGQLRHPESIAMLAGEAKEAGETRSTNRRLIFFSADKAPHVRKINSMVSEAIEEAITQLDAPLRTKRWWRPRRFAAGAAAP
jgi:hypothetical protein